MAAIATESNLSTGIDGYPATLPIGPMTSANCTFGGKKILWRGMTVYNPHPGLVTHTGLRTVKATQATPSTFFLEGNPVAFEGDVLDDGDTIAPLANNTSYGG
jgi:uncharacterized Zn-binding protein involved in type VI secretion